MVKYMTSSSEILSEHDRNLDWMNSHSDELKKKYLELWVAIKDEDVIDHDRSYLRLAKRVKKKYKQEYSKIALGYVSQKPIDLILLEYED